MPIGLDEPYRVFISEDPIGFEGGDTNLFAYALNNPITFYDPNGLDPRGVPNPYDPTYSPPIDNPVLRCHVATHNNPVDNLIGAAIVGGPLVALTAPEVVPVVVRAAYTVSATVLANPQILQKATEFVAGTVPGAPPPTPWGYAGSGAAFLIEKFSNLSQPSMGSYSGGSYSGSGTGK
jgi:hypothetical protein